jgi:RHS repeat-associated protein
LTANSTSQLPHSFHTIYDLAGNVTKDATNKRFIYDAENKQTSFGTGGSYTNGGLYSYDGDGKRIKKIVGTETTIFVYNASGQMVAEYSTTAVQNPQISYLTSDTLGTPRINTNASGQVLARHDYLPFGEEIIGLGNRATQQGYSIPDGVRQKFTQYERDIESGLDFAQARYYNNAHGRFTSVDPLDPVLGRQGASDKREAERQFNIYLGQPQRWNRYIYCLNNPLRHVDPDGFDPLVVNLNIIFDKDKYNEEQQKAFIDSYVAQAKKDFGTIDIQFNVTVTQGTASDIADANKQKIDTGYAEGAINVFVTPGSVGPAPEVTHYGNGSNGTIFLSTGGKNNTENPANLTHGIIHALGISSGVNGYPSVDNSSSNRWVLVGKALYRDTLGRIINGQPAESAAQSTQNHLHILANGGYNPYPFGSYSVAKTGLPVQPPNFSKEINILKEGARKYLKK